MNTSPLEQFRKQSGMSLQAFGRTLSPPVHKTTVMRWESDGVPIARVVDVERATGIAREVLRPDVFAARATEPAQ